MCEESISCPYVTEEKPKKYILALRLCEFEIGAFDLRELVKYVVDHEIEDQMQEKISGAGSVLKMKSRDPLGMSSNPPLSGPATSPRNVKLNFAVKKMISADRSLSCASFHINFIFNLLFRYGADATVSNIERGGCNAS